MDDLPILELCEPNEPDEEPGEIVEDDVNNIFITPVSKSPAEVPVAVEPVSAPPATKVKKPLSEKQKAHLVRAREKAKQKAKEKRELKKAVEERVVAEIIKTKEPVIKPHVPHKITEDFKERMNIPTEEEIIAARLLKEENEFFEFTAKMKKYNAFQKYIEEQNKPIHVVTAPPRASAPPPPPKPVINVNELLVPKENPYDKMFDWS